MPPDLAITPPQGFTPNLLRTLLPIRTNGCFAVKLPPLMSCESVVLVQDGSFRCAGGETRLSFLVVGRVARPW